MSKTPERRRDHLLREIISDYHTMAESAKKNAAGSKDAAVKERYLALFNALTELADILQDRQSH